MRRVTSTQRRTVVVLGALAVSLACTAGLLDAAEPSIQIEVRLFEALWQKGNEQVQGSPTLLLFLCRSGDRWDRPVGVAGNFNPMLHVGLVEQASVSEEAMDLTLGMNIYGDAYVPGGRGDYKVTLKATGDGGYRGDYAGTFRGVAVKGRAEARALPPVRQYKTYPQPIAPGEHPRILFRKSDLPALRQKAETPFGRAVLGKADDAISLGIRYQLTGDKAFARQARQIVEQFLDGDYRAAKTPGSHHGLFHYGYVWEHPAVAYDLCYDAWDEAFKKRVERYVVLWAERILWQRGLFNTQGQYSYGNGEAGTLFYGTALGALALWGEKGPEPVRPAAPDPITDLPPAAGYRPPRGVPVVPLEPGRSPAKWLATPPVPAIVAGDPLADLGGVEKCRPAVGDAFRFEGARYEFQPLAPEFVPNDGGVCLNLGKSIERGHVKRGAGAEMAKDGPVTVCLYTVLDNAAPRRVKVGAPSSRWGHQQFVLAGHTLAHGQVVQLEKGLYPLLVIMRVKARWNEPQPQLQPADDQDVEAWKAKLASLRQEHAAALEEWQYELAEWHRTGGLDQEYARLMEITRYLMYLQFRESVGTGGAQSVTSAASYELGLHPALYAAAYRNCFCKDLSPYNDFTHVLPRRIFAHVYPDRGEPFGQEIHGPNETGADYFAYHFPLVPEEWKPAVLWAWNRHVGPAGEGDWDKLIPGSKWYAAPRVFVNYPLGVEPKLPKGILPLTWEAPDFGYYGFRSGWQGKDDFLVQVWLRSNSPKGYSMPNAGTFRILGFGHEWVIGYPTVRLDNQRYFDPVVLLPEDQINDGGHGHATYVKMEPDGSGVLTADLDEVYCRKLEYEKYGNLRRETTYEESGIRGLRACAVDFSGASGAPCLFVLVDKIAGGKGKVWPWYLAGVKFDSRTGRVADTGEDFKSTTVEKNVVTVSKADGTTMKITFVAPADPEVKAEVRTLKFQKTYNRGESSFTAPGIFATGADPNEGNFFVVVTIQKGPGPEVKVAGRGLDAKATVGKRTIHFDGKQIRFAK